MGLEEVLAEELKQLGAEDIYTGRRGVACVADQENFYKILIHSRIAIRCWCGWQNMRSTMRTSSTNG
jgi:23S rRNA G2445 N2-methylase RlmL